MNSGVYTITNKINGHKYVGGATSLSNRRAAHRRNLRRGTHCNEHLQRAWNKYGEQAFLFKTLFRCGKKSLLELEQMAMDTLDPEYNMLPVAGSRLGAKNTDEQKAKFIAAVSGNKHHFFGRKLAAEHKAKISASMTGKVRSAEYRANISKAKMGNTYGSGNKGRKLSSETRAKISKSLKGNTCHLGHKHTAETRAKMSATKKGKALSAETRAKISAALKDYWARKESGR